jgi:hypothetical protein
LPEDRVAFAKYVALVFVASLGRLDILACRLRTNIRTDDNLACLLVFPDEPLILSIRDHIAAIWAFFGSPTGYHSSVLKNIN